MAADRDGSPGRGVPRLSLTVAEACEALGVSWDFWADQVAPEVRIVRRGRRKLVPVAELARWLDANAELALSDGAGRVARDWPQSRLQMQDGACASRLPLNSAQPR